MLVPRMSRAREQEHEELGFDRSRILEWLESVDLHHRPSCELDEGSNIDPEQQPSVVNNPKPLPAKQLQQQQKQQQFLISHQQQQQQQQQRHSRVTPPNVRAPGQRGDSTISQLERHSVPERTHGHLRTKHIRQKSESPLPEFPVDSELPNFDPQTPIPPGSRAPRHSLRSEVTLSRHQPPILFHARPSLGSVTLSCPLLHPPSEINPPQSLFRSPSPLTSRYQTTRHQSLIPSETETHVMRPRQEVNYRGKGMVDEREEEEEEEEENVPLGPPVKQTHPVSITTHSNKISDSQDLTPPSPSSPPPPQLLLSDVSGLKPHDIQSSLPLQDDTNLDHTHTVAMEPTKERGDDDVEPLSLVELAKLSLRVVDILPQLAVYLGVEYGDYEGVVASEPSLQRQSMSVLMRWYRSRGGGGGGSRKALADALQQFGPEYSQLSNKLLTGGLKECRQTLTEDQAQPKKVSPAPLSPSPLHHTHHPHPSSANSPPHISPNHRHQPVSPSPSHSSVLSPLSRRLKQGFTFDEDRRSSESLPKFLSTQSLYTASPESHPSPLVCGTHTSQSQPVQRHLSLSDISSNSASSWPTSPEVGGALQGGHTSHYNQRKGSLPHDNLGEEMSGCGYERGRRGSSESPFGSHHKGRLRSGEIVTSLTRYDRDSLITAHNRDDLMKTESDMREKEGVFPEEATPVRYQVIGSRLGQMSLSKGTSHNFHRSSLGSRPIGGGGGGGGGREGGWGRKELRSPAIKMQSIRIDSYQQVGRGGGGGGGGGGSRKAIIDRQDSGIETVASNFSTLH